MNWHKTASLTNLAVVTTKNNIPEFQNTGMSSRSVLDFWRLLSESISS